MSIPYRVEPDRLVLHVRLTPKGGRDAIDGVETGADGKAYLKARVAAPPEDGKANAALIALLAKVCGVAKSKISILTGETARLKQVAIDGDGALLAAGEDIARLITTQG